MACALDYTKDVMQGCKPMSKSFQKVPVGATYQIEFYPSASTPEGNKRQIALCETCQSVDFKKHDLKLAFVYTSSHPLVTRLTCSSKCIT
jgi:hypothetical protein